MYLYIHYVIRNVNNDSRDATAHPEYLSDPDKTVFSSFMVN